jgi:hypothetical protein
MQDVEAELERGDRRAELMGRRGEERVPLLQTSCALRRRCAVRSRAFRSDTSRTAAMA